MFDYTQQKAEENDMLDRLERLLWALDSGQVEDPELSSWLHQAIIRHLREGVSLDKALNIAGSRSKFLRYRRDYCLVHAAKVLERDDPAQSIWHRSAKLAELLALFHDGRWQVLQFKPEPGDLDELHQWFFRTLKAVGKPIGHRSVYETLLKNVGGFRFSKLVVNFYHHNKLDEQVMTKHEHEHLKPGRRISDEEAKAFWDRRHAQQAEQKRKRREAEAEAAKLRIMLI